jgi:alcohol dehydrogenase YqhD (iron-dependent ADH family)
MGVRPSGSREEIAVKGIDEFVEFLRYIDMPVNLKELGISPTDADLSEMAKKAAIACGGVKGSAMPLKQDDMLNIFHAAV